jgi:hypothetical protein
MEGTMTTTPRLSKSWTQVNSSLGLQADDQIAPLADGGYVVVWTDFSGVHNPAGAAIVAQRYDSLGNKVGGEVNISLFSSGDQFSPAITPLPNGNIAIAFVDQFAGDQNIYVRISNSSLNLVRFDVIDTGQTRRSTRRSRPSPAAAMPSPIPSAPGPTPISSGVS